MFRTNILDKSDKDIIMVKHNDNDNNSNNIDNNNNNNNNNNNGLIIGSTEWLFPDKILKIITCIKKKTVKLSNNCINKRR